VVRERKRLKKCKKLRQGANGDYAPDKGEDAKAVRNTPETRKSPTKQGEKGRG